MLSAGGLTTLTSHKTVDDLSLFMKHLSASLSETGTVPFEMAIIDIFTQRLTPYAYT